MKNHNGIEQLTRLATRISNSVIGISNEIRYASTFASVIFGLAFGVFSAFTRIDTLFLETPQSSRTVLIDKALVRSATLIRFANGPFGTDAPG